MSLPSGPQVRLVAVGEAARFLCRLIEGIDDPRSADVARWSNIIHHWTANGKINVAGWAGARRRYDLRELWAAAQDWHPRPRGRSLT
jgi:hypothetical protein